MIAALKAFITSKKLLPLLGEMTSSGRPKRQTSQRCLEYNGGLLHEEELAIRRALQASLTSSKQKSSDEVSHRQKKHSSSSKLNTTTSKEEIYINNNNNSLTKVDVPTTKRKKGKQNSLSEDKVSETNTTPTKKTKTHKGLKDDDKARSRSSSRNSSVATDSSNSSTSKNSTTKDSIANSSSSSQTSATSQKMKKAPQSKLHKKDKFAVRVRKKLLKDKILKAGKGVSQVSDCDSIKSSSTVSENVPSKKARKGRKRKCESPLVQKKFASIVPSSSFVDASSSLEFNTSLPLAKAEDFIDFLCLRGHPLMPKEFEIFNSTYQPHTCLSDDESPSSPPSSLISELPSSPASSNVIQNSMESPCETPVCEDPLNSEDDGTLNGIHAMRMYARIESRPKVTSSKEEKREITIAEMDSEEEPNKIPKSVTPPLSFRVSPRSAPQVTSTSTPNLSPSPAPLMITSPRLTLPSTSGTNQASLGIDKPRDLYPTPDSSAFGSPLPPPLVLSPSKNSSSNNCCSPPPLLYIPAAAQRVTHLHGPPKLERVQPSSSDVREGQGSPPTLVKHKPSDFSVESRFIQKERGEESLISNKSSESITSSQELGDQELSSGEPPSCDRILPRPSSTGGIVGTGNRLNVLTSSPEDNHSLGNNLRTFEPYTRNARSCPLQYSSNNAGVEQMNKNSQLHQRDRSPRPKSRDLVISTSASSPSSRHRNQGFCPLHYLKRSEKESSPTKKIPVIDLSDADLPDSSVSLGGSSLLENLQRAHDGLSGFPAARVVSSRCCEHEISGSRPRDSRLFDTSSVGSVSPSANIQSTSGGSRSDVYKSPLNSSPLVSSTTTPEIDQGRFSPSVRRLRSDLRTGNRLSHLPLSERERGACPPTNLVDGTSGRTMYCTVEAPRSSPFVPVRDIITHTLTPQVSATFVGQFGSHGPHLTHTPPPFDCGLRDTLSPPWSHLQPSYSLNTTPPRPYTLSINSPSTSPIHNSHCCTPSRHYNSPRAIPILPPTQLPSFRQVKVVSPNAHFNGEFSNSHEFGSVNIGHNFSVQNQIYDLPRAFEATNPKTAPVNAKTSTTTERENSSKPIVSGSSSSSGDSAKTSAENPSKNIPTTVPSNPQTQSISIDLPTDDTNTNSLQKLPAEASRDQHTGTSDTSRDGTPNDVTKPSADDNDKGEVDTEIKKRRGRPPGSKNKKATPKNNEGEEVSKKESPMKEKTSETEEGKDSTISKKTKNVESPILRPTDEEFKDPIKYLKSVQSTLKKFGICIIDPPESWKLESHLPGNPRFTTKRQLIHRLQKRWGPSEIKLACIEKHIQQQQSSFRFTQMPVVGGCDLDLPEVSRVVNELGGMQKVIDTKKWNKVADLLRIPKSTQDRIGKLQDAYCKYLLSFDLLPESEKEALEKDVRQEMQQTDRKEDCKADSNMCYLKGRSFSMGCFQRTARSFQDHFFKSEPSVNDVEREYWKILQSREKYVAAHHVKLDTRKHGSCFPTNKTDPYTKSGWNLNILPHLKGSSLRHAGNVEDLTVPWLNIDMLFSTKRWTTNPLQTYLIDYLHSSIDKVWYGVPESDIEKFPYTKKDRTNDIEDGEEMVSPNMTRESGVIVTRLVQKQGQFVIIAPEVFHCNISCGYSVSETVAFAFPDWILKASLLNTDLFTEWPEFSYEKVLLKIADEVTHADKEILECLHQELKRVRDREISSRKELKGLGVIEGSCTSTTSKGVQTIKTKSGNIQVHSSSMYCGQCSQLCHLSSVLSEEDSELLCLSDAVDYLREENSSESLSIVTNCPVSQIDEVIESVLKKLNHKVKK